MNSNTGIDCEISSWTVSEDQITVRVKIIPFGLQQTYTRALRKEPGRYEQKWMWVSGSVGKDGYVVQVEESAIVTLLVREHEVLSKVCANYGIEP